MSSRFDLLTQQYDSDLARLEMVSEAGNLLGYFSPETCPFCGAESEHQHLNLEYGTDTTALAVVVAGERAKTEALRGDLQQAIEDLRTEAGRLRTRNRDLVEAIIASETALRTADEELRPRKNGFDELLRTRSSVESAIAVHRQIADLELMRAQIEEEAKPKRAEPVDPLPLAAAGRFSTAIQDRLRAWGFPGADSVRFDRNEFDIVDDEQLRASHGKGVRAVLHAAFTLALADVCQANDLPHPGFVVLDSPLVTYKPPKKGEIHEADDESAQRLDDSFVARFYRSVQQTENVQIIIMENTDPPEELAAETIDIEFTDSNEGRHGFLAPTQEGLDPPLWWVWPPAGCVLLSSDCECPSEAWRDARRKPVTWAMSSGRCWSRCSTRQPARTQAWAGPAQRVVDGVHFVSHTGLSLAVSVQVLFLVVAPVPARRWATPGQMGGDPATCRQLSAVTGTVATASGARLRRRPPDDASPRGTHVGLFDRLEAQQGPNWRPPR